MMDRERIVRIKQALRAARLAALVLRLEGTGLVSGWPWRWQAVDEDPVRSAAAGLTAEECAWLFQRAQAVAGGRRLRCFLPVAVPAREGGFPAGATLLRSLQEDDEGFLRHIDVNTRRAVKRAAVMQAAVENFVHGAELQFGEKTPGQLFSVIAEIALRHAGNPPDGAIQLAHAKSH